MPTYHTLGQIPRKRHIVFRRPDGGLYAEQPRAEADGIEVNLQNTLLGPDQIDQQAMCFMQFQKVFINTLARRLAKTTEAVAGSI